MHPRDQVGFALPHSIALSQIDLQLKGHHCVQIPVGDCMLPVKADLLGQLASGLMLAFVCCNGLPANSLQSAQLACWTLHARTPHGIAYTAC